MLSYTIHDITSLVLLLTRVKPVCVILKCVSVCLCEGLLECECACACVCV